MKKLFLILIIVLVTCEVIGVSFDDIIISAKEKGKPMIMPIRPNPISGYKSRSSAKHTKPIKKYIARFVDKQNSKVTTRYAAKVATKVTTPTISRRTINDLKNLPVKGINGLFKGKIGEAFRKLPEIIKKAIAWLKQNGLWNAIVIKIKNPGEQYDEYCGKFLPEEVCKGAKDFISKNF